MDVSIGNFAGIAGEERPNPPYAIAILDPGRAVPLVKAKIHVYQLSAAVSVAAIAQGSYFVDVPPGTRGGPLILQSVVSAAGSSASTGRSTGRSIAYLQSSNITRTSAALREITSGRVSAIASGTSRSTTTTRNPANATIQAIASSIASTASVDRSGNAFLLRAIAVGGSWSVLNVVAIAGAIARLQSISIGGGSARASGRSLLAANLHGTALPSSPTASINRSGNTFLLRAIAMGGSFSTLTIVAILGQGAIARAIASGASRGAISFRATSGAIQRAIALGSGYSVLSIMAIDGASLVVAVTPRGGARQVGGGRTVGGCTLQAISLSSLRSGAGDRTVLAGFLRARAVGAVGLRSVGRSSTGAITRAIAAGSSFVATPVGGSDVNNIAVYLGGLI